MGAAIDKWVGRTRTAQEALIRKDFDFLRSRAETGDSFTAEEWATKVGRRLSPSSQRNYIQKKWKDFVWRQADGTYIVRKDFLSVPFPDFKSLYQQAETLYTKYREVSHEDVLTLEFFMPLTHERRLRTSLDRLFYTDTVRQRLLEVGLNKLQDFVPKGPDEGDDLYLTRLTDLVANAFVGYSVGHVSGRFRIEEPKSKEEAYKGLAEDVPYLVDETTAIVKFIMPLVECRRNDEKQPSSQLELDLANEGVGQLDKDGLRSLFRLVFVEAFIRFVRDEDEVWLLETTSGQSLRRWVAVHG